SVSNSYSFSTATHGRSRRLFLTSSFFCACSASSLASSSRAVCHSSRDPILCSGISTPFVGLPDATRDDEKETPRNPETHRSARGGVNGSPKTRAGGPFDPPATSRFRRWNYLLPMTKVRPVSPEGLYFASPAANVALSAYDPGFRASLMLAVAFPVESVVPTA